MNEFRLRLTAGQVDDYAAATGDRNPHYLDPAYARRTSFGGRVLPGALVVIAALAAVPAGWARAATGLTARFPRPLFPERTYRVVVSEEDGRAGTITVREGDLPVLAIEIVRGGPSAGAVRPGVTRLPREPESHEELKRGDVFTGSYGLPRPGALRELADRLGAQAVPDALLGALAWGSWFAGMRAPGRDAVLSGLRVREAGEPEDHDPRYAATITTADARTGTLAVNASCTGTGRGIEVELRAFRRRRVPTAGRTSATSVLPAGERLAGRKVLAVGGSRGIGAAIVSVLAAQGAGVWATERAPGPVEALSAEFGADRVRPLVLDAGDDESVRAAIAALAEDGVRLDGLVLSAGPAVLGSALHPDGVDTIREFVDTSLTVALRPLTAALELLEPGGWIVLLSSGAVDDVPDQLPQYLIAKSALEALGRYCAKRHGYRVLLARAPKMWTDLTNGPLGGRGTVPVERVAATIVGWVLGEVSGTRSEDDGPAVLSPAELAEWSPDPRAAGALRP
ncbi:SDR family oxidoreductase [Amycolatopsis sp. YIM 10]|uniref:SDR family oxidoreductase n=1 Tax=Amycolatopsis sp. YIM 10 TaxID=2653857 RepID=UPI0012903947|nr:SDR family oxidoreductase [Amycolatopsis sp. YIM 10]QFU89745.1 Cyclic-di-GMP-binding biofilm dispersal mediator protein [Amycolatopsis sp. YIM 10]